MEFNELSETQKARARECKSTAELIALAQEEGVELDDAQLEAVSGGAWYGCTSNEDCKEVCWGLNC